MRSGNGRRVGCIKGSSSSSSGTLFFSLEDQRISSGWPFTAHFSRMFNSKQSTYSHNMRNRPRFLSSPRSFLIRLHVDLFAIDRKAEDDFDDTVLTPLEQLVLVLEDRRFFSHGGVDSKAVIRVLWRACTLRSFGGASTIDMQFVRTATGYRDRTIRRKMYEMLLAFIIQWRYTKIQILRSYISCAFFGSHMNGCDRASALAFNCSVSTLSLKQTSELAAMLVFPRPLRPNEKWRKNVDRRAAYGLRILPRLEQRFEKIPSGKKP